MEQSTLSIRYATFAAVKASKMKAKCNVLHDLPRAAATLTAVTEVLELKAASSCMASTFLPRVVYWSMTMCGQYPYQHPPSYSRLC